VPLQDEELELPAVRVGGLAPERAPEAGALLAASHAFYPAFRQLFPERKRRRVVLRHLMVAAAHDSALHGRAMAAERNGTILGVALWMPRGTFPLSTARKLRMAPALVAILLAAPSSFPGFVRVGAALAKLPGSRLWYLQALGVHPTAQRRGIGARLIEPALALADADGVACHLHTSDPANVPYYQRFGFAVTQPVVQARPQDPRYIGMTRPPGVRRRLPPP
jgi:GNAT superfamily N-acetyltransferase